ncbi:MAG: sigma-54 dependent transcriptional regulator [Acidobacteriota bacterium]|nr:sigma-54 dependent transcriptional regulator [Acidobacteriota bacterium]
MSEKHQLPRVLVVDDEILQRKIVSQQLQRLDFASEAVATAAEALQILQTRDFDVVLLDVEMSDLSGLEALPLIKKLEDAPEVVMLTLDKTLESGIAALRAGAYDYLTKPATLDALEMTVRKATEKRRLVRQNSTLRDFVESKTASRDTASEPIQTSPAMQLIVEQAEAVARLNSTVLITGESGTGKDVLARYIHRQSRRAKSAMVSVNCGAMPETLFESEFFGYEKGAFSGANQTKRGLIEVADSSTLFLDEIGEMPPALQVKLLRFLESGEFRRVGGTRDLYSDTRLIAATNQDLTLAIRENRFRSDLFYRLNVIHLHLPPLRERATDLPVLTDSFLDFYRRQFQKPNLDFTAEARRKLEDYNFPGNIRELKNIIERAAALASNDVIKPDQVIFQKSASEAENSNGLAPDHPHSAGLSLDLTISSSKSIVELAELERRYILAILNFTKGNRERAASLLGVSERTLYRRLREYE